MQESTDVALLRAVYLNAQKGMTVAERAMPRTHNKKLTEATEKARIGYGDVMERARAELCRHKNEPVPLSGIGKAVFDLSLCVRFAGAKSTSSIAEALYLATVRNVADTTRQLRLYPSALEPTAVIAATLLAREKAFAVEMLTHI